SWPESKSIGDALIRGGGACHSVERFEESFGVAADPVQLSLAYEHRPEDAAHGPPAIRNPLPCVLDRAARRFHVRQEKLVPNSGCFPARIWRIDRHFSLRGIFSTLCTIRPISGN